MTSPEQTDIVAALQKGADAAFEKDIRYMLSDLDAGEEIRDAEFARVRDDYVDTGQAAATQRIDALCGALGIDPADWGSAFIGGTLQKGHSKDAISSRDVRHCAVDGWSIGRFVTEQAFGVLPIEELEDGEGYVDVSLSRGGEHILRLQAEASLCVAWPDAAEEVDAEESDETELEYYITYKASIFRVEP